MSTKTKTKKSVTPEQMMRELLLLAEAELKDDRRAEVRYPFFRPASVQIDGHCFSAFTREISPSAIGLLHNMEMPLKGVVITIAGHQQDLHARIERCESIGEGWYISGGKIVGTDA